MTNGSESCKCFSTAWVRPRSNRVSDCYLVSQLPKLWKVKKVIPSTHFIRLFLEGVSLVGEVSEFKTVDFLRNSSVLNSKFCKELPRFSWTRRITHLQILRRGRCVPCLSSEPKQVEFSYISRHLWGAFQWAALFGALRTVHGRIDHSSALLLRAFDRYRSCTVSCEIWRHVIYLGFQETREI